MGVLYLIRIHQKVSLKVPKGSRSKRMDDGMSRRDHFDTCSVSLKDPRGILARQEHAR
jgi:hypothetical protein